MGVGDTLHTLTLVFPQVPFFPTSEVGGANLINQGKQANRIYPPCSCDSELTFFFPTITVEEESLDGTGQKSGKGEKQELKLSQGTASGTRQTRDTQCKEERAFLALRVRQGNGHVVKLTELGLSISMLSRISFLALR